MSKDSGIIGFSCESALVRFGKKMPNEMIATYATGFIVSNQN
jgi:hypothetical protein